jgi:D-glycero-D-manno-heptose 1,7-bisphosphate phosphatase
VGIADVTTPALTTPTVSFRVVRGPDVPGGRALPHGIAEPSPTPARRAAFVDRDGVLIRAQVRDGRPSPVEHPEDVEIIEGAAESCAELRRAGILVVVVTNQPDVARGTATIAGVEAIHQRILDQIEVDAVVACYHDDIDDCQCRKPRPGMLTYVADQWDVALTESVLIGDRWRDVEAGKRCGCQTVFVDHGYDERAPDAPDLTVGTLAEALPWILAECGP